jgi:hypothetical protein
MTYGLGNYTIRARLENVPSSHKNKDETLNLFVPNYIDYKFDYDSIQ